MAVLPIGILFVLILMLISFVPIGTVLICCYKVMVIQAIFGMESIDFTSPFDAIERSLCLVLCLSLSAFCAANLTALYSAITPLLQFNIVLFLCSLVAVPIGTILLASFKRFTGQACYHMPDY
jgi:hypothetical protein